MRGILRIPRVEEMKPMLSCEAFLPIPIVEALNASLQCSSSNAQSVSTHAKHNSTASSKKRKSHLEPSVPLRAQKRTGIETKATTPATVAQRSQLFSATEAAFTRKNTMFRANPNTQIAS